MKKNHARNKFSYDKCEHNPNASHNPLTKLKNTVKEMNKIDSLIAGGKSLNSIFMEACRADDYSLVKSILLRSELTELELMNGFILSCTFNCLKTVTEIFKQGIDIHYNLDEPLRIAVRTGSVSVVKFLIDNGADLNANTSESMRIAKLKNNRDVIDLLECFAQKPKYLINNDKEYNLTVNSIFPSDSESHFHILCSNKEYIKIKEILKIKPNILKENSYLIGKAIINMDLKLFKLMIPYGADVKDIQNFIMACATGYLPMIKFFVKNGANQNILTLSYTCKSGSIRAVTFLMEYFKFSDYEINSAFSDVVKWGKKNKKRMLRYLLERGADIDYSGSMPLQQAIDVADYSLIDYLIKLGAKPYYASGLVYAAITNKMKSIKFIIRKSKVENINREINDALSQAISMGNYGIAKYLIKKCGDIRQSAQEMIDMAIVTNKIDNLNFLFENVVKIEDVAVKIFVDSVKKRAFNVLQYLLDKGFAVNVKNAAPLMNLFQSSCLRPGENGSFLKDKEVNLTSIDKKPAINNIDVFFDNRTESEFVNAIKSKNVPYLASLLKKFDVSDISLKRFLYVEASSKIYSHKILKMLLRNIKDINSIDDQLLENLFKLDNQNIVPILIEKGLNLKDKIHPIIAGIMLSDNINLFKKINWERIPYLRSKLLLFALAGRATKILVYFLYRKLKIKNHNYSALQLSIRIGNINILKMLVSHGATFHPFEKRYLMMAYNYRQPQVLRYLIDDIRISLKDVPDHVYQYYLLWRANKSSLALEGADFNKNGFRIYANREEIIREDIEKVKIRYQYNVLSFIYSLSDDIYYAVNANRSHASEYLISLANSEIINSTMLKFLLDGKYYEAKYLITRGAKVNYENNKPMLLACLDNDIPFIEFLIQNGLRVHPDVDDGLNKSLINECYESANYLLSRGADIHYEDDTIIRSACLNQNEKLLNFLIGTNKFNKEDIVNNVQFSIANDKFYSAKILLRYLPDFG